MLNRNIINVLYNYDYNIMKSNSRDYLFFGKQQDEIFKTVVFVDDTSGTKTYSMSTDSDLGQTMPSDKSALCTIKNTLERTLLLKGFHNVEILFIISSNSPFAYKELADEDIPFWIIDNTGCRIISYGADDSSFLSLRDDMEKRLSPSYKEPSQTLGQRLKNLWKQPVFTWSLALINIVIFVYMDLMCGYLNRTLITFKYSNAWELVIENREYYRLFTCMFLHGDLLHLFSNMVTLYAIGMQLETTYGHFRYILTYILSGLAASGVSLAYHWYLGEPIYSLGASGAIFGIFGAYAVFSLFDRAKGTPVPAIRIGFATILLLANSFTSPYIDNAAHLGGIIAGSIISFICCICRKNKI